MVGNGVTKRPSEKGLLHDFLHKKPSDNFDTLRFANSFFEFSTVFYKNYICL